MSQEQREIYSKIAENKKDNFLFGIESTGNCIENGDNYLLRDAIGKALRQYEDRHKE